MKDHLLFWDEPCHGLQGRLSVAEGSSVLTGRRVGGAEQHQEHPCHTIPKHSRSRHHGQLWKQQPSAGFSSPPQSADPPSAAGPASFLPTDKLPGWEEQTCHLPMAWFRAVKRQAPAASTEVLLGPVRWPKERRQPTPVTPARIPGFPESWVSEKWGFFFDS